MNRLRASWLTLCVLILLCGGCDGARYLKCPNCNAAYKATGGLPGQHSTTCRKCGGQMFWTTEESSGWDEERFQRNGDEIK